MSRMIWDEGIPGRKLMLILSFHWLSFFFFMWVSVPSPGSDRRRQSLVGNVCTDSLTIFCRCKTLSTSIHCMNVVLTLGTCVTLFIRRRYRKTKWLRGYRRHGSYCSVIRDFHSKFGFIHSLYKLWTSQQTGNGKWRALHTIVDY